MTKRGQVCYYATKYSPKLINELKVWSSYLKKIAQPFKTVQFKAWKIAPSSISLKKENCFEPPKVCAFNFKLNHSHEVHLMVN